VKAALHTSLYLASKCWWLSQESIQFQIYVFRRDFIECPARAIFITQRERRLIAFFCCRCCRITRPFIISRMSETLFPISPSTLHASAQHFSSYSTSAHFYCGRWCSLTLSCCAHSHSHTHIIRGRYWRNNFHLTHSATARTELELLLLLLFTFAPLLAVRCILKLTPHFETWYFIM
jgi:hypothetical protein